MPTMRLTSLLALILMTAACAGTSGSANPGGSQTPAPTLSPDPLTIDHPKGAGDVVLRFEEGGGFVPADFIATQAPAFTLYGDGTVVFRDSTAPGPDLGDGVVRGVPFRTARLSEDQVQALLDRAISRGALGIAKAHYDPGTVADAPTATFTLNAGSIKKTVSAVALGMEAPPSIDTQTLAALADLGALLRNFDPTGTSGAQAYKPSAYRAQLLDAGAPQQNTRAWPWPGIKPADFKPPAEQADSSFLRRVFTPKEVAVLGLNGLEGGASGLAFKGPDKKTYTFTLRPLLPDEQS